MSDRLHDLPVIWMALVVFGVTYVIAGLIYAGVDRANAAVDREASALSAIVIFAASFPAEPEQQMRALVSVTLKTPLPPRPPHQARIARDVGCEDRRGPTVDASWPSRLHGASSVTQ